MKNFLSRLPNFLNVDTKPFDPEMYNDDEQNADEAENMQRIKLKVENTIRWRFREGEDDPSAAALEREKESNARFVRWSDGSLSLVLGDEVFQVNTKSLQNQHQFLVVHHPSELVLQTQQALTDNMTFQPQSTQSLTHRKLTAAIAGKHVKGVKTVMVATLSDPKAAKEAIEQRELEQVRSRRKVAAERSRHARVTGLTASGLEESDGEHDEEDDDFDAEEERRREKIMVSRCISCLQRMKWYIRRKQGAHFMWFHIPLFSLSRSQDQTTTSLGIVTLVMKTVWTMKTSMTDVIATGETGAEIVAVTAVRNVAVVAAAPEVEAEAGVGAEVAVAVVALAVVAALHTAVAIVAAAVIVNVSVIVIVDEDAATVEVPAAAQAEAEAVLLPAHGTSDALDTDVIGMRMEKMCAIVGEHLVTNAATRMMKTKVFKDVQRREKLPWIAMTSNGRYTSFRQPGTMQYILYNLFVCLSLGFCSLISNGLVGWLAEVKLGRRCCCIWRTFRYMNLGLLTVPET